MSVSAKAKAAADAKAAQQAHDAANQAARKRSAIEEWLATFLREPGFLEAYPYYAAILAKMTPVADPSVSRAAVSLHDGRFFLHLNVDSFMAEPQFLRGVLLHEVHHVVLGHLSHTKFTEAEEPELMDLAVEMSANEYIVEPLPPAVHCHAYADIGIRPGQSTWDRYQLLLKCLQGTGKIPRPSRGDGEAGRVDDHQFFDKAKASPGASTQAAIVVESAIRESREERAKKDKATPPEDGVGKTSHAPAESEPKEAPANKKKKSQTKDQGRGKSSDVITSGDEGLGDARDGDGDPRRFSIAGRTAARIIEELSGTTRAPAEMMDWRAALELFVARARSPIHTWSRPNRRFPQRVFEVPGRSWALRRTEHPRLLVGIDTSLSMARSELEEVARQLVVLGERAQLTIAECDVEVTRVYPFAGSIDHVAGRGGTDLRPIFAPELLGAHDIDGVIYFTDGEGPTPEQPPLVPTLWVLTKATKPGSNSGQQPGERSSREFACPWGERAWMRVGASRR